MAILKLPDVTESLRNGTLTAKEHAQRPLPTWLAFAIAISTLLGVKAWGYFTAPQDIARVEAAVAKCETADAHKADISRIDGTLQDISAEQGMMRTEQTTQTKILYEIKGRLEVRGTPR